MMVFPHFLSLASLVTVDGEIMLAGDHRQLSPIIAHDSVWIAPQRTPAITNVGTTGLNYRGRIEVRRVKDGTVRVINHVTLQTYVDGIA